MFLPEPIDPLCKQELLHGFSRSLSDADRDFCQADFSLLELAESLNGLSLGKLPGPDGFSVEFYSKFWRLLGPLLLRVARECFWDGFLPSSMKGSATRLIFKKRGNRKNLKNWLPISLPNVD